MLYPIIPIQYYNKIVITAMTNNPKEKGQQHTFSLIRLKPDCKIPPTFADFSPLFSSSTSNGSILPSYNDDCCHFTHAFLLLSDKKTQLKRRQSQKMEFENQIRLTISSTNSQKTNGLIPSSNYCQICQSYFKNYDQHLDEKSHFLRWHHNQFNQDIQQLCSKANDQEAASCVGRKRKMIKKIDSELFGLKYSPKTTVYNYPKSKMSVSYQEGQLMSSTFKSSFELQNLNESSVLN